MNYDLSIHTNPDANAWAKFFMQAMKENPNIVLDETLMVGWFANAMMAMHDHLQGGGPINGDHAQHLVDATPRSKAMTLPPLPKPLIHPESWAGGYYTAEQIKQYAQQCREAALEEAAALCNGEQWRNEGKVSVAYIKAFNEGCVGCEGAVRGLK